MKTRQDPHEIIIDPCKLTWLFHRHQNG